MHTNLPGRPSGCERTLALMMATMAQTLGSLANLIRFVVCFEIQFVHLRAFEF